MDGKNRTKIPLRILLCGATLSGNMGGQALYLSIVDNLRLLTDFLEVTVLSKYPGDDHDHCNALGWKMVSFPTWIQLLLGVPLSLALWFCRSLHLSSAWISRTRIAPFANHDILIDLSGISFTDDRPISGLIINCLWLIPALATRIPFVKASQAMGPFRKIYVRVAALLFLSRASAVIARGPISARYLQELMPDRKVYQLPDVAFALKPAPGDHVFKVLRTAGLEEHEEYCVVGPSYVLESAMSRRQILNRYADLLAQAADQLSAMSGLRILLVPHERSHMGSAYDDLKVCEAVFQRMKLPQRVVLLKESLSAPLLKGIIAGAQVAIGSRFHFMVAALSSGVPSLAIGWSHKYAEMMHMLGQEKFSIGHDALDVVSLSAAVDRLWGERKAIKNEISRQLPEILRAASSNAVIVLRAIETRK
jgi:colanic acid/amylovoran biosynthesis protein